MEMVVCNSHTHARINFTKVASNYFQVLEPGPCPSGTPE